MINETTVPSAPEPADMKIAGGQVFERLRRKNVDGRRCAPCDNSWVAVDRIVFKGRLGLLFHRDHDCFASDAIKRDLVDRDLRAVGFEVLGMHLEPDGQLDVITADCPGVRLRALVEVLRMANANLPQAVAWYIVSRTAELCRVWSEVGVKPLDTFVGFDGSLHLFPAMPACWQSEMPSFLGNEVFDPLLVDKLNANLVQLLCATLPPPGFHLPEHWATIPPEVQEFLDGPRNGADAVPALASLVQEHFPRTHARHHQMYQSLARDLDTDGRIREAWILGQGTFRQTTGLYR